MSTSAPPLLQPHFASLARTAATKGGFSLSSFCSELDTLVGQLRAISRMASVGRKIVFSLDLCELLDASWSLNERKAQGKYSDVMRRRVLTDVTFSRHAMRYIELSGSDYTILPGAAAEILLFLRHSYSDNARLIREYKGLGLVGRRLGPKVNNPESYRTFERIVRRGAFGVSLTDRFIHYVARLLDGQSFASPLLFQDAFDVNKQSVRRFRAALDAVRPPRPSSQANLADAINLAVVAEFNKPGRDELLIHMTRTSSLHRLSRSEVQLDISLKQRMQGVEFPILCHPHLVCLLSLIKPTARGGDYYSIVEGFSRFWATMGSHLREYEHALSTNAASGKLMRILDQIEMATEGSQFANLFFTYLRLFSRNVARSEQMLYGSTDLEGIVDIEEQKERIRNEVQQWDLLDQQQRLLSLYEAIRAKTGIGRAMRVINEVPRSAGVRLSLAEKEGLVVEEETEANAENGMREYHLLTAPASARRPSVPILVGLQCYLQDNAPAATVFWPSGRSLKRFGEALSALTNEGALSQSATAIGVGVDGSLEVKTLETEELGRGPDLVGVFSDGPLSCLQIDCCDFVFTCEVECEDREAYESVRFRGEVPPWISRHYERTSGALPGAYVVDFIEVFFVGGESDADSSSAKR